MVSIRFNARAFLPRAVNFFLRRFTPLAPTSRRTHSLLGDSFKDSKSLAPANAKLYGRKKHRTSFKSNRPISRLANPAIKMRARRLRREHSLRNQQAAARRSESRDSEDFIVSKYYDELQFNKLMRTAMAHQETVYARVKDNAGKRQRDMAYQDEGEDTVLRLQADLKKKKEKAQERAEFDRIVKAREDAEKVEKEAKERVESEARELFERHRAEALAKERAEREAREAREFMKRRIAEAFAKERAEHEAWLRTKHEARLRAQHEARIRAQHEANMIQAEHEARTRAEHEARIRAEYEARMRAASRRVEELARAEHEARVRAERLKLEDDIRREQEQRENEEKERVQQEHLRKLGETLDNQPPPSPVAGIFLLYDAKWDALKKGIDANGSAIPPLSFSQIPWPILLCDPSGPQEITRQRVEEFLFHPCRGGYWDGKNNRSIVRNEMIRWHPDKFNSRVLSKVKETERQAVALGAGEVACLLTSIMEGL